MSSYVIAAPERLAAASADLGGIGEAIRAAHAAAASSTTGIVAAAGDEVSASIAALFGSHAREFEALSAQSALFHDRFVQALSSGAGAYAGAEPPTLRLCRL
jgi:PE family